MPPASIGSLELVVLLAIVRLRGEAHGLAIRADVSERTRHDYSVGAIYTTLERLESKGLVSSRTSDPLPVRGGRSRRHFKVTAAGNRALAEARRVSSSVWAGLRGAVGQKPA